MNYNRITAFFSLTLVTGIICLLPSCVDDPKENSVEIDRQPLLTSLADNVIIPGYENLNGEITSLNAAAQVFVETPEQANLSTLRTAFTQAYRSWQAVAFFNFGPGFNQTLRAEFNTYPADYFSIENSIESGEYNLDSFSAANQKGLPALDYLLYGLAENDVDLLEFYTTDQNSENRKTYLTSLTERLKEKIDQVYNGWIATEGNYRQQFINQDGNDAGSSISLLINSLSQYFEVFTRDAKIGIPLGKRSQGDIIPKNVEAYYNGDLSITLAADNLRGIKNIFTGSNGNLDGVGLYNYLKDLKAQSNGDLLADVVISQLDQAIAAVESIPSPLSNTIESNPQPVEEAHGKLQQFVFTIKAEIPSATGVLISYSDNDGD
ncbi:imelysin family protein [Echinicola jeungdonensis]|uniref:Imelysin family protein n=1 Tax=Echinicola jeungdonensis TaxID=709343 RepID=A0ABV5J2S4_9BACT|nr:imelysin family protein [Echinicola jeungdonensis]MDN3671085.1 imelysin family protein [Echinicola jeungdonensis]